MTRDELLTRIRATSVVDVMHTIAADPDQACDFVRTLGPHLVAALIGEDSRRHGVVRTTSAPASIPSPRADWARHDWMRWRDWMANTEKGFRTGRLFGDRVVKAFGKAAHLSYRELRSRLAEEDAVRLDRLCAKQLAA